MPKSARPEPSETIALMHSTTETIASTAAAGISQRRGRLASEGSDRVKAAIFVEYRGHRQVVTASVE